MKNISNYLKRLKAFLPSPHFNSPTLHLKKLLFNLPNSYLRPMRKLFHILSLCGCLSAFVGDAFPQSSQLLEIERFDDIPGMSGVGVLDIWQDRIGYLWLATDQGLIRYDGYNFKPFRHVPGDSTSIGHDKVMKILEDEKGNLWLGLYKGGVSCYDRRTGGFRNYTITRQLKPSTAAVVGLAFDGKGRLWAGVPFNGLVRLDTETGETKQFNLVTAENSPNLNPEDVPGYNVGYRFFHDEDGNIWASTSNDLYIVQPETGAVKPWRPTKKTPPGTIFTDQAYSILPEGDFLWVGGWESGIRQINRRTGAVKQFMFSPEKIPVIYSNVVNDLRPKGPDEFWVASQNRGLGVFNKKTGQYYWFADHPEQWVGGPPIVSVGAIAPDNQGNLWVVADGKLARIQLKNNPFYFTKVKVNKMEDFGVSQILEDREGRFLFIGTQYADGLHVIEKKTSREQVLKFWVAPTEAGALLVMDLLQSRAGTIWVLTHHTVLRYNLQSRQLETPAQPTIYSEGKISNFYTDFAEDPQGNLWLGTTHLGLVRYNPRTGESRQFMPDENDPNSIATNVIGSVEVDGRGRIWFGSRNKTAYGYYLPNEQKFVYLDGEGKTTLERATLRMNSFHASPNGNIWACTEEGALLFDCSGEHPCLAKKYTVGDGLPSNYVVHGVEDRQGNFWGSTNKLVKIEKKTGEITAFGKNEGVNFVPHRLNLALDGSVLARMNNGYVSFNPEAVSFTKYTVPIGLTSFKIDGDEYFNGSNPAPAYPLVVPPASRYFSFEFAALDLARAGEREYEYRLQGFDNQWIKCRENRFVNFTNIPAGHYSFEVKPAGAPDSKALAVPLVVQVAFYKTGWFWLAVAMSIAGLAGWLYRRRKQQERQLLELKGKAQLLEKEKATVMYESLKQQLNPHFLFNSLTSLGSLIHIDPKAAAQFLDSLSKTYRYILKSSDVETVPLSDELKFAETYVKLQKTRFEEGLQVFFKVKEEHFYQKIVPVTLQNLIENAIKHNIIDEESPLVVEVFVENSYLVVRNNLQKKNFVETSNRQGLSNLKSFYHYLSDREIVVVEDGAFFTIKIPLL